VKQRLFRVALVLLVVLIALAFDILNRAGELNALRARPLNCRKVGGIVGPEDIAIDRAHDVAYLSSTDVRAALKGATARGGLYRYRIGDAQPTLLYSSPKNDFHPHGIAFWSDGAGPDLLYVVNHPGATEHALEVFEVDAGGVRHVQTLRDPALLSPNDVVAVGRGELYVTNDHGRNRGAGQLADDLLRRERAQVLHVRGDKFRIVADDLAYANGIAAALDRATLYVAETTRQRMRVYGRAPETGDLTLAREVELYTGADNIEVAPDGSQWIGAHPKLLTFLRHQADERIPSPSEVIRVERDRVQRVFLDLGSLLSASTVATPLSGHVLIGAVFADHFLDCELPAR
jgi:arylesterase / paraoxonase